MYIITIHQPHFLPWLGYFNKIVNSDEFIILDDIKYRKNYYQNRTQILNMNGITQWLTVPIHARSSTKIMDVEISNKNKSNKVLKSLYNSYTLKRGRTSTTI